MFQRKGKAQKNVFNGQLLKPQPPSRLMAGGILAFEKKRVNKVFFVVPYWQGLYPHLLMARPLKNLIYTSIFDGAIGF